jgi:hypothetical protein
MPFSRKHGGSSNSHHTSGVAKMVDYAHPFERVKAGDTAHRETPLALKQEVIGFTAAVERCISGTSYHLGNFPIKISHETFSLLPLIRITSFC